MIMSHPGMTYLWAVLILIFIAGINLWVLVAPAPTSKQEWRLPLTRIPLLGGLFRYLTTKIWPLLTLRIITVAVFSLIILAGIFGTNIPSRNIATVLTWNIWWTCIVFVVIFSGSSWCGICPWDTVSNWIARQRIWRRSKSESQGRGGRQVPKALRNVWMAFALFLIFTWMEIGLGITDDPFKTALLSLLMTFLAVMSMMIFSGRAFCRHACPIGRTIGFYSQLSAFELRTGDTDVCKECTTLECYHGSETIAPCPSKLVVGKMKESTYCTSCGNCTQSCPKEVVSWRLRPLSSEAKLDARPHLDESFFILGLLGVTIFHAFTMLGHWEPLLLGLRDFISPNSPVLISFTILLMGFTAVPILVYWCASYLTRFVWQHFFDISSDVIATTQKWKLSTQDIFCSFAFVTLPLAFSYHLAHNLNHLMRENSDLIALAKNPFGWYIKPLTMAERHEQMMNLIIPQDVVYIIQTVLMIAGFWIAAQVIRYRGYKIHQAEKLKLAPILLFADLVILTNVWMMVQPMQMRM